VVRVADRNALHAHLAAAGVGTEVYYPMPLHLQACFSALGFTRGAFPEAERAAAEALALPIYPELTAEQQAFVVEAVNVWAAGRTVEPKA
jgi:dTDP-4-amino-4,6-dideoxygalactose transaminase